jgi:hypothetical protein
MRTKLELATLDAGVRRPRQLWYAARHLTSGALANAGQSLETIRRSVGDRSAVFSAIDQLSEAECLDLLASRTVGRLAYVARAGTPDIVPVNYRYVDGRVVIRSAPGPKLQAAERRERVALEVDELDEETRSGWSVVVHGRATVLRPEHEPPEGAVPWAPGPRRHVLQVVPERVTGRRLDPSC